MEPAPPHLFAISQAATDLSRRFKAGEHPIVSVPPWKATGSGLGA
jgi:hypothetical protein